MGVIRGGLLIFVSVFLFITILLGGTFLILSLSLQYENVQKELGVIAKNLTQGKFNLAEENFNLSTEMQKARAFMEKQCVNETSYVFASGGYTFVIPCSILNETNGSSEVFIDSGVENIIENIYYDSYDCDFFDCFKESKYPLFLVSEKAKNYWLDKFYISIIIFAVLSLLVFLLVEHKQNTLIIIGSFFAVSAFILLKLEAIPQMLLGEFSQFVGVFFSQTLVVFWTFLASGIVLIIFGIAFRILGTDLIKKKFSKEDVKKIVKEEISKKDTGKRKKK